jgi:hypothetical protein
LAGVGCVGDGGLGSSEVDPRVLSIQSGADND